jgi:hypothetical protein
MKCTAVTAKGKPCKNDAVRDGLCAIHGGKVKGEKAKVTKVKMAIIEPQLPVTPKSNTTLWFVDITDPAMSYWDIHGYFKSKSDAAGWAIKSFLINNHDEEFKLCRSGDMPITRNPVLSGMYENLLNGKQVLRPDSKTYTYQVTQMQENAEGGLSPEGYIR